MSAFQSNVRLDKRRIARSFSRAAASYDSHAQLQRDIGQKLLAAMPDMKAGQCILDLGSGTGYFTRQLLDACPESTHPDSFADSQVLGLDLAEGMLKYSAGQPSAVHWLCADAESLPLADHSLDVVFSSLAIQWCENLTELFSELKRVLRPGACAYIATLGPETLSELRQAWSSVDSYTHVNDFAELAEITKACFDADLSLSVDEQRKILTYPTLRELTADLKGIGAHNVNKGELTGLSSRARIEAFRAAYEAFRDDKGLLPASYQVYYLTITG